MPVEGAREEAERRADALYPEIRLAPENEQRAEDFIAGFMACVEWAASRPVADAEVLAGAAVLARDDDAGRGIYGSEDYQNMARAVLEAAREVSR